MPRPAPAGGPLVWAGLVTWVVAGLPQALAWTSGRAPVGGQALVCCAAYAAFLIAFLHTAQTKRLSSWRPAGLAFQSVAALVLVALGENGFEAALLCVVAGEAPLVAGERTSLVFVVAQAAAMVVIDRVSPFHTHPHELAAVAYVGFQLFAFGASRLAAREARGREELARIHAELVATRELFADSTAAAERLRIARELHDALGHHLTALSLQLELARNVAEGRAREPVASAQAVTKELLTELRTVVGALREDSPLDLGRALRTLVAGIPHPHVHLEVDGDLAVDAALAHTVFRCVQEALTNAVRHARAENVYVTVSAKDGTLSVLAKDDGRGVADVRLGNGLSGLRERIEQLGGEVEIEAAVGAGLTLRARLPDGGRGAPA